MKNKIETEMKIVDLYFCSLEQDPTGAECEFITAEMEKMGIDATLINKAREQAYCLFAKNGQ